MATANKTDILLRSETNAPLATKGSEFTWKNLDDNFITIYNQLVSLSNSSNVDAYDASLTYSTNEYVTYNNQLYKMISASDQINITPDSDPAIWSAVYASDLVQAPSGIKTFRKLIPSAEVLTLGYADTPVEIIAALGANKVVIIDTVEATLLFDEGSPAGTPYATSTSLAIIPSTLDISAGDNPKFQLSAFLQSSFESSAPFDRQSFAADDTYNSFPANTAIQVVVNGANPTAGDSDILITGTYRIIDITN